MASLEAKIEKLVEHVGRQTDHNDKVQTQIAVLDNNHDDCVKKIQVSIVF